jgi:hypothetical protein
MRTSLPVWYGIHMQRESHREGCVQVVEHTRLVRISRDVYQQMLQGPEPLVPESPSTTRLTKQRSVSKVRSPPQAHHDWIPQQ